MKVGKPYKSENVISALMTKKKITQQQMSETLGVSQRTVSNLVELFNGKPLQVQRLQNLEKMFKVLGLDFWKFMQKWNK